MRRKHRKVLSKIAVCVLIAALVFTMTGFAHTKRSTVMAATVPEISALTEATTPNVEEPAASEETEPDIDSTEIDTEPVETEPVVTEPIEPDVSDETKPTHEDDGDDYEHVDTGCDHFWRREYEPETATEEGYLIDSCLHCGEWYIVEVIPPYGE